MATVLPTRTDTPFYTFEIDLDLRTFTFEFRWNDRLGAWVMQIQDLAGTVLLAGRRVVLDTPLLARFRDPRLPDGELLVIDTTDEKREPGLDELGPDARCKVLYYSLAELRDAAENGV
jgi:hypothetical protein